jgi:hypothetical protein
LWPGFKLFSFALAGIRFPSFLQPHDNAPLEISRDIMPEEKNSAGRRQFLRCGLIGLTAIAGLGARNARAQDVPKSTKEQAGYQDNATSDTCAVCSLFIKPHDCQVVQGPVSANGSCNFFTA